jgi:hypothetical protein
MLRAALALLRVVGDDGSVKPTLSPPGSIHAGTRPIRAAPHLTVISAYLNSPLESCCLNGSKRELAVAVFDRGLCDLELEQSNVHTCAFQNTENFNSTPNSLLMLMQSTRPFHMIVLLRCDHKQLGLHVYLCKSSNAAGKL